MATTSGTESLSTQSNQTSEKQTPEKLSPEKQTSERALCEQVLALIPAFALGATDPEETLFVQAGLARCPQAVAALAEYTELSEHLSLGVAPIAPPDGLADRLQLALGHQSQEAQTSARERQPLIADPPPWLARLWRSPGFGFAAAALALALLLLSNVYWESRYNELESQHLILQRQFQEQTTLVARLRAGHFQRLEMAAAAGGGPTTHAMVMYDPTATQALLYAEDFPPLPAGQVYQLWLIQGENRTNGGLFQVDADGFGVLVIDAPEPLRSYERMGITPEPEGGSPGPTAPPVVTGAF